MLIRHSGKRKRIQNLSLQFFSTNSTLKLMASKKKIDRFNDLIDVIGSIFNASLLTFIICTLLLFILFPFLGFLWWFLFSPITYTIILFPFSFFILAFFIRKFMYKRISSKYAYGIAFVSQIVFYGVFNLAFLRGIGTQWHLDLLLAFLPAYITSVLMAYFSLQKEKS